MTRAKTVTALQQRIGASVDTLETRSFLSKMLSVAPGLIYVFNQNTQSNEYANRNIGDYLGYDIAEIQEMGDAMMPQLAHPDDLPKLGAHFQKVRNLADDEICELEYRMRHQDGSWVWLLSYDTVFDRDETGHVIRHIGVAADITKQKQAEEAARARQREADAISEELRSFAYSVSHDIKAPSNTMRLILSELQTTQSGSMDDEGKALVDLGLQTVSRMQGLIEDVLSYTRIVGEAPVMCPIDLGEIVAGVLEERAASISASGAQIEVGHMHPICATRTQMQVLISNLLQNALQYHRPEVTPIIKISTEMTRNGKTCVLTVTDNGIGIPETAFERIFSPFGRLHLQTEFDGTGLGLAICRRIAMAHGGNISVQSTPGKGSRFAVTLAQPEPLAADSRPS